MDDRLVDSPDAVIEAYADRGIQVAISDLGLEGAEEASPMIVIEGDAASLEFLGYLFLAMSRFTDCGFSIDPTGAGKAFCAPRSQYGLYVHRIPCVHQE